MQAAPDFAPLYRQAAELRQKQFGPEHPKAAESLMDLALYLREQGDRAGAAAALRSVIAIRQKTGPKTALAEAQIELAGLTGRPDGLLDAIRTNEANPQAALPPRLGVTMNNLALAIESTDAKLAERLYRLAIRAQRQTPQDPEYASALHNYASLLLGTGRAPVAEAQQRKALAIFEAALGADHPRVAVAASNLGDIVRALGRPAEAEKLYRRTLAIDEQVYGPGHAEVAGDLENLAGLLEEIGRSAEARTLRQRAQSIGAVDADPVVRKR